LHLKANEASVTSQNSAGHDIKRVKRNEWMNGLRKEEGKATVVPTFSCLCSLENSQRKMSLAAK